MSNEFKISISEVNYLKLKEIANKLNLKIDELVEIAFCELFDLIRNEPDTFLESIGFINELKKLVKVD